MSIVFFKKLRAISLLFIARNTAIIFLYIIYIGLVSVGAGVSDSPVVVLYIT